ncbi:MAG: tetratricopeptide repeat protein [Rubrivivax sp.]
MTPWTGWRNATTHWAAVVMLLAWAGPSVAQPANVPSEAASPAAANSQIDAPLFYQLLIGEIEYSAGRAGNAYQVMLDAARRTSDEQLYRRATEIALRSRAGDQALAAATAWRAAAPASIEPIQLELQILLSLNRSAEVAEPMRALISNTAAANQSALIASLPRYVARAADKRQAAALLEEVLKPYAEDSATRAASQVAMGRAWLMAGDVDRSWVLLRQAYETAPANPGPALLALEIMPKQPLAEGMVSVYLTVRGAEVNVRRAYAAVLVNAQRYPDALAQVDTVTQQQPELAAPWLTLGALKLELRDPVAAEKALLHYVQLQSSPASAAERSGTEAEAEADGDAGQEPANDQGLTQAWLLLAQAAEQRGDLPGAEAWLAKIENPQRALEVQVRRASLLARQGKVEEARDLVRRTPERTPEDARSKLIAEAQVLREVKQWEEAFAVLEAASKRFPDDTDVVYEQAMMAEKLDRLELMERLLRRVIEMKPEHAHAYNALGYSLAERKMRLAEAKQLIQRALELLPGDPFITDSLGWVEFRLGNMQEALRLLRIAYKIRPDTEIAAHLGEVLWAAGQQDEARRVWAEARTRDAANDVLRETLARLKAGS